MLLVYLQAAPSIRPIKLDDHRVVVLDANLVNPVFITVQRQDPGVAEATGRFDGRNHEIGREARVGVAQSRFSKL